MAVFGIRAYDSVLGDQRTRSAVMLLYVHQSLGFSPCCGPLCVRMLEEAGLLCAEASMLTENAAMWHGARCCSCCLMLLDFL